MIKCWTRICFCAATALVDEPVAADGTSQEDVSGNQTPESAAAEEEEPQAEGGLLSEVEALTCRMTPTDLSGCSSQQLVQLHDQLGGLMQRVVVELHTRLQQSQDKPWRHVLQDRTRMRRTCDRLNIFYEGEFYHFNSTFLSLIFITSRRSSKGFLVLELMSSLIFKKLKGKHSHTFVNCARKDEDIFKIVVVWTWTVSSSC